MKNKNQSAGHRQQIEALDGTATSRRATAILKTAFRNLMGKASKGGLYHFNNEELGVLVKQQYLSQRKDTDCNTSLLVGFEFLRNGQLDSNLIAPVCCPPTKDHESFVAVPMPFSAINSVAVSGTTHVKMISVTAEIDLERGSLRMISFISAVLPWQSSVTTALEQCHTVKLSHKPVLVAVGMVCYREYAEKMFTLKNGMCNPLTIVRVTQKQNQRHEY